MNARTRLSNSGTASGIAWRIFAGTAAVVGLVVVAALVLASTAAKRTAEATARRNLEQSADLVAQLLAGRERSMAGGARVFVQAPYFRTLVAERGRDDILDQAFEAAEQLEAEWVFITDGAGILLAKSDEPSAAGDALGQIALITNALRGQVSGGFGVSGDSMLFQVTAVPIAVPGMAPVGVLVATRVVDSAFVRDLRLATASEVLFFVTDRTGTPHIVTTSLPLTPDIEASIAQVLPTPSTSTDGHHDATIAGETWISHSAALATAGGEVVGGFLVLRPQDAALATLAGVRRSLAAAAALGFFLALVAGWLAARSVSRPIRALADAVHRASEGNYDLLVAAPASDRDATGEIGALARAIEALLIDLQDQDSLSAANFAVAPAKPSRHPAPNGAASATLSTEDKRVLALNPVASPLTLERGAQLANRYRIEAMLGSGGMGIVYSAHDRALGEMVTLKVLRPEMIVGDANAREHLREELRLARRITHRNVVRIHDIGDSNGIPFLTMEYVEGASLLTVIRLRGSLPLSAVLSLGRQLMRALAAAHDTGIVHADIKPANILINPSGIVKVTDFGVSRIIRAAHRERHHATVADSTVSGHVAGAIVGTPQYLAPELLIGGPPSVAGDLYAAGVVLHECLVGTTPYGAETPVAFLASKLASDTSSAVGAPLMHAAQLRAEIGVPPALEALLIQLLNPDDDRRPASAADVYARLVRIR